MRLDHRPLVRFLSISSAISALSLLFWFWGEPAGGAGQVSENDELLNLNRRTKISKRVLPIAPVIEASGPMPQTIGKTLNISNTGSGAPDDAGYKMLFLGDIMLDRYVGQIIRKKGLASLLDVMKKKGLLDGYSVISANLEGAVTGAGKHYGPEYENDFAFPPAHISQLQSLGLNFFNIANNHLADQGAEGVVQTRDNLDNIGMAYSGCPDGQTGECSYRVIKLKGKSGKAIKIGMVGFSMVYRKFDQPQAGKIIEKARDESDIVIVNIHWGSEYKHKADSAQAKTAHLLIDAGADLIIGHHPHVVQGQEEYKGKMIFYSLGNFIFDQYFSPDTQEGLAVIISLTEEKVMSYALMPLRSENSVPRPMSEPEKASFMARFEKW